MFVGKVVCSSNKVCDQCHVFFFFFSLLFIVLSIAIRHLPKDCYSNLYVCYTSLLPRCYS